MPSTGSTWERPVAVVALLVLLYAVEVSGNALFGAVLAAVLYLVAWLVARVSPGNPLDDMTRERRLAAGAVVLAVLVYSVVVAARILVAATIGLVAWVTSPVEPVARWLDRAT
jgi:multisubunit Na+/H+ antiporter MnhG subunit